MSSAPPGPLAVEFSNVKLLIVIVDSEVAVVAESTRPETPVPLKPAPEPAWPVSVYEGGVLPVLRVNAPSEPPELDTVHSWSSVIVSPFCAWLSAA